MNDYSKLSAEELRDLLLNDKLFHQFMTEEDYTALLDIETDYDEPSEKVIDFCFNGLSSLPKYDDINQHDFDIRKTIEKAYLKAISRKRQKMKKAFLIAAAIITFMLVTQLVASAFGFDLLGYIFNWHKPDVIEIISNNITDTGDDEDIEIEYLAVEEIPFEMKNLVSDYIFNNFQFYSANFIKQNNSTIYKFIFFDEKENILSVKIEDSLEINIEKDDDGYYEEYKIEETVFTIFTNMGDYRAAWIQNDYVYSLYTHFDDLQDLKNILDEL